MFDLRQRIFIIAGVGVGLIAAVLLLYRFLPPKSATAPPEQAAEAPLAPVAGAPPINAQPAASNPTVASQAQASAPAYTAEETAVRQLARLFVERFGSYSNQGPNGRIADVMPLATPLMQTWLKTQDVAYSAEYQGYTTKVVAMKILSLAGATASVHIDAQQIAETAAGSVISYQSGRVELVKVGSDWKVNGLYWEKK